MKENDCKLEELRLLFDRENTRKQNLENKASYFLGCISIVITIVCTFSNSITFSNVFYSYLGWGLLMFFLFSIGFCISIFLPKDYYHPFILDDYQELENSFKVEESTFKKNLYNQYLIASYMNHNINDEIANKLKYSFIFFIWFLIIFGVMEGIL